MEKGSITDCGNSQNCVEVCPKSIKLMTYPAQLNRDVNNSGSQKYFRQLSKKLSGQSAKVGCPDFLFQ